MTRPFTLLVLLLPILLGSCSSMMRPAGSTSEAGFVSLFNGRDLTGWHGATSGYAVENGQLICLKEGGGNLYADGVYDDFVLRFEFLLEPGGNNGVAIRAEEGKDAAYHGMEIQILDDYAPEYASLKDWQFHGSIYGVVPARRGFLRPAGTWNEQEILADGSRIRVTLNGTVIVDADLEQAARPATVDERPHPGLFNERGSIGFLGHNHRVAFRNIRLKRL